MIRTIVHELEPMEPPILFHTKHHKLHLNANILFQSKRKRLPFLVSEIAQIRCKIKQEHYFARHILRLHHADCIRSIVLSFL
jgi:hypothetical protein